MLGEAMLHPTQNNWNVSVKNKDAWVTEVQVKVASRCRRKALNWTMLEPAEMFKQERLKMASEQIKLTRQPFSRRWRGIPFHSHVRYCQVTAIQHQRALLQDLECNRMGTDRLEGRGKGSRRASAMGKMFKSRREERIVGSSYQQKQQHQCPW